MRSARLAREASAGRPEALPEDLPEALPEASRNAEISPWRDICALDDIWPDTGECALLEGGRQIAIFRAGAGQDVYALDNFDPFSRAFVLSRGIVGDRAGVAKVASPMYKQSFALATGECLDDPAVRVPTYPARVRAGRVEIQLDAGVTSAPAGTAHPWPARPPGADHEEVIP